MKRGIPNLYLTGCVFLLLGTVLMLAGFPAGLGMVLGGISILVASLAVQALIEELEDRGAIRRKER